MKIQTILQSNDKEEVKALFLFNDKNNYKEIIIKFRLWSRYFFPQYFTSKDAPFHKEMDLYNLQAYKGDLTSFVNIAFRGASKTARVKLFIAFCVANDEDQFRKYIRILSDDIDNAKQSVLDIYNMFVYTSLMYPEIFKKTAIKREETMGEFTTTTGIKLLAKPIGVSQRGKIMEDAKSDFDWYDDFESRMTLRSAVITNKIADNMEEARTGLALGGSSIYTANYISEAGNVHKLIEKKSSKKKVLMTPIMKDEKSTWDRYSIEDIEKMKEDDDDFEGERMNNPAASKNVLFNRESVEKQVPKEAIRESAGLKIFKEFDPSHRTASGHDVGGGVGLDSSTSVYIDFDIIPCQVIGTFKNNEIKPDVFGDEINRESDIFGGALAGIEKNNHGHATIARAKQLEVNQYQTEGKATKVGQTSPTEYGWHTNSATKPKMLFALSKAVEDGLIDLNDPALIAECKGYTRDDLMEKNDDPRLTTRHFDLLIACAIAWQMKDFAEVKKVQELPEEPKNIYDDIGI